MAVPISPFALIGAYVLIILIISAVFPIIKQRLEKNMLDSFPQRVAEEKVIC